ncbi:MAG: signal peptide peptidase SppA [candidate division Zixibacteria bacterium HGW-Zixibacteria-1]|nr:MAG: signal peptide peptidase SppA [candidate division Zixibacteria bacterium HGW-Zixibacteria-1]
MARKRDVVIAVIIIFTFVIAIGFFGLMFLGAYYADDGVDLGGFREKIAVVEVYGGIYESASIIRQLKKWGESNSIRAIILHIDSPGGAVAPSQEIYEEILRVRNEDSKPVIVAMSSVAASGGYLIACAADKIMANPGTMTGSIGVIIQFPTIGKLLDKIGVSYETVKSGELKDVGAFNKAMTENERKMLTSMITDTYEQFVDVVSEGRGIEREEVYKIADGSIFSGRQALALKLVDTLGGFEDAVRLAADMAGIEGKPRLVREVKPKPGFFDILGSLAGNVREYAAGEVGGPRVMYLY